jgi:acetyl esterase/lipase
MTTAFTSIQRGLMPPKAILAFYCPTNYEDAFWSKPNYPENSRNIAQGPYNILEGVQDRPITSYNVSASTRSVGGWMAPADPRSRIVLHMNWKEQFMPVLLRGLPTKHKASEEEITKLLSQPQPCVGDVQSVSPYAQIVNGTYKTPTFMVHGTDDDLIPWQQSTQTVKALRAKGVPADIEVVDGKVHLFDIYPDKDGKGWAAISKAYDFIAKEVFN